MSTYSSLGIITSQALELSDGLAFFAEMKKALPALYPKKVGNYEPVRTLFDPRKKGELEQQWRSPFIWKGAAVGSQGNVWFRQGLGKNSDIICSAKTKDFDFERCQDFLGKTAKVMNAAFIYAHPFQSIEIERARTNETLITVVRGKSNYVSVSSIVLEKYIPDVYWYTIFGPPFVKHFGLKRLLATPANRVVQLGDHFVGIQLTGLSEILDGAKMEEARSLVKSHLGQDAFFSLSRGASSKYRVCKLV
ncbi:MAG: hypothetical protein NXI24_25080 [bacterium]|nr:hypothetical protein [bacterium]